MKWSVLWGDRLASQAPRKGMGKQSRHSSSDSPAFSYTLHFSFKKLDWTWCATAMEENQSFHPIKFTGRQSPVTCLMLNGRVVFFCFERFFGIHVYWYVSVFELGREKCGFCMERTDPWHCRRRRFHACLVFQPLSQWWVNFKASHPPGGAVPLSLCFFALLLLKKARTTCCVKIQQLIKKFEK